MSTSHQDGTYPRPQLCRPGWRCLDGSWAFVYDDQDTGMQRGWFEPAARERFDRRIAVPYPPESAASGIGDRGAHRVQWYRRELTVDDLPRHGTTDRVLLHFGAVDYRAQVWVNGRQVADHVGGQTPFTADITDALDIGYPHDARSGPEAGDDPVPDHVVVVRAEDDPHDQSQPRGKQTWQDGPHKVWYERTSGIWQSVWLEAVPATYIEDLAWHADPDDGIRALIELAAPPGRAMLVSVDLELAGRPLAHAAAALTGRRLSLDVPVAELGNGVDREELLWSPEHPVLLDATVSLREAETGAVVDVVTSYVGVRKVGVGGGRLLLNGRPYFLRAVLNQGYRATTHLANRGTEELRAEVELAKAMGFNGMRIHQKVEDPRMLFWADRLGLLVWSEIGASYEYSATAVQELTVEWMAAVRRDRSHPCVVAWVPINESWGVPNLGSDAAQRQFVAGIAGLTRGLDPSRPVLSNEGWEHVDSDILGVHDYTGDPAQLAGRYGSATAFAERLDQPGDAAAGRVVALTRSQVERFTSGQAPLVVSEFGGLALHSLRDSFAYTYVTSDTELATTLHDLFEALRSSQAVAGFCYTQLIDTGQETNGLADEHGEPKLPLETIRYIVTGEKDPETGP
jgi:hypothetical protein